MRPSTSHALRTGLVAGLLGFATVSLAFAVLDLATGRGIGFTPALLGGALFGELSDACVVQPTGTTIAAYSGLHLLVFLTLGWFSAWLLRLTSVHPWFWINAIFLFVFVAFHLYGAVLTILAPVTGCFSLYYILGATALAAGAMIGYLLARNPGLASTVSRPENQ
jgi:hypothetical protein